MNRILRLLVFTVILVLTACTGDFLLPPSGAEVMVDRVTVTVTETEPPQYFAVVTGHFPDSCTGIDHVEQELSGNTIIISLATYQTEGADCSPVATAFEETILLDVTGLPPGSYAVEVNGTTTTFILEEGQN